MSKELIGRKFLPQLFFLHFYPQGLSVKGTCVAHLGAPALCKDTTNAFVKRNLFFVFQG